MEEETPMLKAKETEIVVVDQEEEQAEEEQIEETPIKPKQVD